MKIAYFIESMSNSGGMERVISMKANWLVKNTDISVSIVTYSQHIDQTDFFALSEKINRVRLEISDKNFKVGLNHKLTDWLNTNPQDICISTYGREFRLLPFINDSSSKIVEFHFAYDINKHWLANTCGRFKTKVIGNLKTRLMVRYAKKYDRIVCLTKADEKKWNTNIVTQIYNPITIQSGQISDCSPKVVLAIGRMDKQKGFDILLKCWGLIEDKHTDWVLKIIGGGDPTPYIKLQQELKLKNVEFCGRTDDVPSVLQNASIYVLSSRYEGFSLTICEAMRCALPIVTFDCPSGPAELVRDGVNGYLIDKVGDIDQMSKRISDLIENEHIRKGFGENSYLISQEFAPANIMGKWISLFEELTKETNSAQTVK